MADGREVILLKESEALRRKNEALAKKCDTYALERHLELLKRDNMRAGLCTPVPEKETPMPQSKPNYFEGNVTLKKTPLEPSSIVKAATYDGQSSWRDYRAHFEACAEINKWEYNDKGYKVTHWLWKSIWSY
ncbi:hypothetical protein DPMN_017605 [Dreissena polymorpha]|uniref:Uncharacterized protein n=1 Tax=Dreissena polymorpha TaxID=45954 RepID=A0A9D4S7L6_DREPO|nr:hypothetical protein DPMN_017605 [Dreissena polymorpha]